MLNYVVPCLNYVADRYMKYFKKRGISPGESGSGGGGWTEPSSVGAARGSGNRGLGADGGSHTHRPPRLGSADMPVAFLREKRKFLADK